MTNATAESSRSLAIGLGPARVIALLSVYVGLWLLLTPYAGLSHDAQAYAFQALARLDPTVLGQDVFLRYASQDRFTIFPSLYAHVIQLLGLETAAATLTFLCHLLWYVGAFLVARSLFGVRIALLALGLLIAIPGPYGGQRVFHIAEPFLSARLPAEAICLFALWCWLENRVVIAAGLLAVAALIHPLMAFPAALLLGFLWIDRARPLGLGMGRAALVVAIGAVAGSWLLGGSEPAMDAAWAQTVRTRSAFIFLDQWLLADWNHTFMTLATLALASLVLAAEPGRRFARATLILAVTGLALAAFSSEVWNLKILMQGQPWRWVWIGRFLAIAVLPSVLLGAWSAGTAGRATALLLAASWLVVVPVSARAPVYQVLGALFALMALAVWAGRSRIPESTQVLLKRGALAMLVLVLLSTVITASLTTTVVRSDLDVPGANQRFLTLLNLITPAVLIAVSAWVAAIHLRRSAASLLVLGAGVALTVVAWPVAAQKWTARPYSGTNFEKFADWREVIPRDAEVLWWNQLRDVWFLLQRRSYLTVSQGAGVVFSGDIARELRRRADNLQPYMDRGFWFAESEVASARPNPLSAAVLQQICGDPALGFVISTDALGVGELRKEWPDPGKYVYLYDCRKFRTGPAP